eukprot:g21445.t1
MGKPSPAAGYVRELEEDDEGDDEEADDKDKKDAKEEEDKVKQVETESEQGDKDEFTVQSCGCRESLDSGFSQMRDFASESQYNKAAWVQVLLATKFRRGDTFPQQGLCRQWRRDDYQKSREFLEKLDRKLTQNSQRATILLFRYFVCSIFADDS